MRQWPLLTPRVSHQLRPGYWRHAHIGHTSHNSHNRGWASGWLVTCFLIIPSLASLRSLTRMSQIELQQTKQQLGSRGLAAARARLLMAIIQCFMIQPGYWGLPRRSTYAQECLQSREILKVVRRHFSDTSFAAGADWAGLSSCDDDDL